MDFAIPAAITAYLAELDAFIEPEIGPIERENDTIRFFDRRHRPGALRFWAARLTPFHRRHFPL